MKFQLGQVVATRGVANAMAEFPPFGGLVKHCLGEHAAGRWGELDAEDRRANDRALLNGSRLLSAYELPRPIAGEGKIWIITEADRSVTTILFPSEY